VCACVYLCVFISQGEGHYSVLDSREELALQEIDNGKMSNGETTEELDLEEAEKRSDEEEVCRS